jgi:hypothetical protein
LQLNLGHKNQLYFRPVARKYLILPFHAVVTGIEIYEAMEMKNSINVRTTDENIETQRWAEILLEYKCTHVLKI